VVCLECGKEFPYDWQEMKIVDAEAIHPEAMAASASESYAAK
jgi:hypothetical protein